MPFKKGDPRINRKGRPKKGKTLTDILEKKLKDRIDDPDNPEKKITKKEWLAKKLIELVESGSFPALRYVYDRIDGMPIQVEQVDMQIDEITINRVPAKDKEK